MLVKDLALIIGLLPISDATNLELKGERQKGYSIYEKYNLKDKYICIIYRVIPKNKV
jgi:hypothetical protein